MAGEVRGELAGVHLPQSSVHSVVSEFLELPQCALPVAFRHHAALSHSDRGDTACRSCPTRSMADTTPLPCFSPVLTDAVAFHYFPVTYTNTTFNKLSKLQLSNKNRFLCSDCWSASLLGQCLISVHGLLRSLSSPAHTETSCPRPLLFLYKSFPPITTSVIQKML